MDGWRYCSASTLAFGALPAVRSGCAPTTPDARLSGLTRMLHDFFAPHMPAIARLRRRFGAG
jgi:hypothetical protein